jgi:hypothetical protein
MGRHHQIKQIRCGGVVGDQVGGGIADTEVQDLDTSGAFTGGHLTCTLGHLVGVALPGDQNADWTVENLVHTIQHQILVVRGQHCCGDLVAAAKY